MNTLFIAARAVHYASAMLLFGELVFVLAIARPALRDAGQLAPGEDRAFRHALLVAALWAFALSVASGAAWLATEAAVMSGMPLEQALSRDTLMLVLGKTMFGRVWVLRLGLIAGLCALLPSMRSSLNDARLSRSTVGATVIAAAYLGTLAWTGHATAGEGLDHFVQLGSDVLHLLAAGGWLGALPGLVFLLGSRRPPGLAAQATRRFSIVGMVSVGVLVLTGATNAWYLVGNVPALVGTDYGRLLLIKLALFAAMVVLATVNRWYLTPRVSSHDRLALGSLRRNAILEIAAGVAVVAIVGALGITVPAAHQSPIWPFDYTLSWQALQESTGIRAAFAAASTVACIGAVVALQGVRHRRPRRWVAGFAGTAAACTMGGWLLAVPAYPTTYAAAPVPYSVDSIMHGSALYAQNCSACHGALGHGDGPAAASLPIRPSNLTEHVAHHHPGDLFWWIAHGIPATPMPGLGSKLRDAEIWDLVQFVHAQADAEEAVALTGRVEPWRPIVAPDFTFEFAGGPQESLKQQRGHQITLLVLYTLPQSLPLLRALSTARLAFEDAGARIIGVGLGTSSGSPEPETIEDESILAITAPSVAAAYAMFARQAADVGPAAPLSVAYLIDRQGYLRARWIGAAAPPKDQTAAMLWQIKLVSKERAHRPAWEGHMH